MDYFNLQGLRDYVSAKDETYNIRLPQSAIFYDTRDKLRYLVSLIAERTDERLDLVYSTRPNAQAGKGLIKFQNYVLTGFAPRTESIGDDLFIKFSFSGLLTNSVVFAIDLDMNFKRGTSPYISDRDSIYENSLIEIPIDDKFPQNWDDLISVIIDKYVEARKKYSQIKSDEIARLFKLYEEYLKGRIGDIKPRTAEGYLETAKEAIPLLWQKLFNEDFSNFSFNYNEVRKLHFIVSEKNFSGSNSSFYPFTNQLMNKYAPPLNQILYGPPGTGKTFRTKELALEIIDGTVPEGRYEVNMRYDELFEEGQIQFTTFHQSLSYEDFIEGIKPDLNDNDDVIYTIQNGIFKELSKEAQKDETSNFDVCFQKMILDFNESEDQHHTMKTPKGTEFHIAPNSKGNLSLFTSDEKNKQGTFTKEKLKDHFEGERAKWWENYVEGIIDYMKTNYSLVTSKNILKNYVLIIDEINRGNIASIFGELITLLEKDKRKGEYEELEAILPYSKKPFSVPNNLFIIGTMNTADKSVEALDSALRRRFHFTEINYDPEVLRGEYISGIDLEKLLTTINDRVELLLDKDHKIGHAYLIGIDSIDDLKNVFERKIIPLLEEYFFGDHIKVGLVLGDDFVREKNKESIQSLHKSFIKASEDYSDIEETKVFEFVESIEWDEDSFKNIYERAEEE